jgi:HAD superfamily hydrolase (TIGR01549 family)
MKLIVFDLFGTLVRSRVRHSPYRKLIRHGQEQGRSVKSTDARVIMSLNCGIREMANYLNINAQSDFLNELERQIAEEVSSLELFEDVPETLEYIKSLDLPIALCSNLAQPYGEVIEGLLKNVKFQKFLSYEVGCIKPDMYMYKNIADATNVSKEHTLFVGDNYICDYSGPLEFGFHARHLVRGEQGSGTAIGNLRELMAILEKN